MIRRRLRTLALFTALVSVMSILNACGDGSSHSGSGSKTATLTAMSVTPTSSNVPKGASKQLAVSGTYSDGTHRDLTSQVTWTSSASSIATVSSSGMVHTVAQGQATITATMGGRSGNAAITVSAAAVQSMAVTEPSSTIALGRTEHVTATGTYTDGSTHDLTNVVTWSTAQTGVVQLTSGGMLHAVGKGAYTVTAADGSVTASASGTVVDAAADSITISPAAASLPKGSTQVFRATANMSDGTHTDVTTSAVWQSSNSSAGSISSGGLATAVNTGTTQITATYAGVSGSASLSVSNATVLTVLITPTAGTIAKGTTLKFKATGVLSDGSTQDLSSSASWDASPSSACTVNSTGLVSAVAVGACDVSAVASSVTGHAALVITPATLVSISITPLDLSVNIGGSKQIVAIGTFSDGSTQDVTLSATFGSSNTGVATVSASGLLQGVAAGSSNITATLGSIHSTSAVTVSSASLVSITVGPLSINLAAGLNTQLTATGTFSDGSTHDLTATVDWSSSNSGIAAIGADGKLTGIGAGNATITATSAGVSGNLNVGITAAQVVAISINPGSVTLAIGQNQPFTATATLSDGTTMDVTTSAHWSVTNTALGNISNSSGNAGFLTAVALGTTTVSATVDSVSGSATLTVNAAVLTGITVTPLTLNLALGISANLTATGVYSDGSTQDLTANVDWSSSNPLILNVNGTGIALPLAVGNATITATTQGISGSATASVTAPNLVSISISAGNNSLAAGLSLNLSAIGHYSDGSTQDITASVQWSSSSLAVATVSGNGLALAVAPGNATISAKLGSVTGTFALGVNNALLQAIVVTAQNSSFALGFNLQLTATGNYSDGTSHDLTSSVAWSSDNVAVALVNNSGLVSGLAVGPITAKASLQGVEGTLPVTVNAATLVSVSITPLNVNIVNLLLHQQFTLTGHFSDGSTQALTGAHWSTSNTLLGLISSNGLLSPLALGDLTITATYGSLTATATAHIL